jgi:ABC-type antimicrobial peptide transport system permease subunit
VLLGVIGIYGSVAQIVRTRRREIGIRLALGAQASEVIRMAVGGTAQSVALGTACGLGLALVATGTLRALLFGVAPRDPAAFAAAAAILLVASTGSAFLAARRAASVNPTEALRVE